MPVVAVVVVDSKCMAPALMAKEVWAGLFAGTMFGTELSIVVLIGVSARTVKGGVTGVNLSAGVGTNMWSTMPVDAEFRVLSAPLYGLLSPFP